MSNWKTIGLFALLGFAGVKLVAGAKNNDGPKPEDNPAPPKDNPGPAPAPAPAPAPVPSPAGDAFPLKVGSRGNAVRALQKLMIEYATRKGLPIAKNDPMKLDANGDPDGSFGPQTERWSINLMKTSVVQLETYNWLLNQVNQLRAAKAEPSQAPFKVGDKVYAKGKITISRYPLNIVIKRGTLTLVPTFEQAVAELSKGIRRNNIDTVDFSHGEYIGRVAHITGDKVRIVATESARSWWRNPIQQHNNYFVASTSQIFK